eukprot:GHVO01012956.1.p1 GENE.GHVO01012956.1~~GHVO01012956.1.p1  ORF type:complete len:242 (+),score=40.48 GHVO01012956.1:515-1240(+)
MKKRSGHSIGSLIVNSMLACFLALTSLLTCGKLARMGAVQSAARSYLGPKAAMLFEGFGVRSRTLQELLISNVWRFTTSAVKYLEKDLKEEFRRLRSQHGNKFDGAVVAGVGTAVLFFSVVAFRQMRLASKHEGYGSPSEQDNSDISDFLESEEEDENEQYDTSNLKDGQCGLSNFKAEGVVYVEKKLTDDEYKRQRDEQTKQSLQKLLRSDEWRQHVRERGHDDKYFNWQKAEREKNKTT